MPGRVGLRGFGCCLALLLAAPGCRRHEDAPDTLFVLGDRDVEGLDPHTAGGIFQTQTVLANVYEGLVAFDAKMGLVPALAVSWSNPDDNTWDFAVRRGVRFHTGAVVTPDDVVFSLERARDHPASVLRAALAGVEDVRAIAPAGVRIRTSAPDASLLHRLAEVSIVSRRFVETKGEATLASSSCGTGPYFVSGRVPGETVELQRFEGYWRGPGALARARFVARRYGDPDLGRFLPQGAPLVFWTRPGTDLYRRALKEAVLHFGPQLSIAYLGFDLRGPATPGVRLPGARKGNPFLDPRVRQAVALAIDGARLRHEVADDEGFIPTQLVARPVFGFDDSLGSPKPDREAAQALMAQTPFALGFEVDLDVRELMERYGPPVADDLQHVGIRARVRTLPEAEFFDRVSRGASSLYILRFSCRTGDAQEFFDKWVHSRDKERGYGEFNYSYQINPFPGLDGEIEAARRILDTPGRLKKLRWIMRRVMEERLAIPLINPRSVTFVSPGLTWTPRADTLRLVYEFKPAR